MLLMAHPRFTRLSVGIKHSPPPNTYPRPPDRVRDCLHLPPQGQPDRPGLGGGADAWKVLRRAFPWERGSSAQGRDMRVTRACCRGGHDPDPVTP